MKLGIIVNGQGAHNMKMLGVDGKSLAQQISKQMRRTRMISVSDFNCNEFVKMELQTTEIYPIIIEGKVNIRKYLREWNEDAAIGELEKLKIRLEKEIFIGGNIFCTYLHHEFLGLLNEQIITNEDVLLDRIVDFSFVRENNYMSIGDTFRYLIQIYSEYMRLANEQLGGKTKVDFEAIKRYIHLHYREPISLESISNTFNVSKGYLCKSFKQHFNETVMDYIMKCRMTKAQELIKRSDMQIKNVANATGYDDIPYFYRIFKRYYGITPGRMREMD